MTELMTNFEEIHKSIKNIENSLENEHFISPIERSINQYFSSINHKLALEFGKFFSLYHSVMSNDERECAIIISLMFYNQHSIPKEYQDVVESLMFVVKSRFSSCEKVRA
jgi:hypothetical protein